MKKLFDFFNSYVCLFWNRIADSTLVSDQSLSIFRWVFGIFLLIFETPYYGWIGDVPQAFFDPPLISLANFFNIFPSYILFRVLDILVIICILTMTIGFKTRISAIILLISLLIGSNFLYSFGKVDHGNIMEYVLLFLMIFSNWGKNYALIPEDEYLSTKHCLSLFAVILAFGMFTAGVKKAIVWIDFDWDTGGALSWLYGNYFSLGRHFLLAPMALKIPHSLFEFIDYFVPIFEMLGFIALIYKRKTWLFWLLMACMFHFGNALILNVAFQSHFLAYLVFIDYTRSKKITQIIFSKKGKIILTTSVIILSTIHLIDRLIGRGSYLLFIHETPIKREYNLYFALGLWFIAIIILFTQIRQPIYKQTKNKPEIVV